MRSPLDELIRTYTVEIKKAGSTPSRTKERKNLKNALSSVREARTAIRACGVVGQSALRAVALTIGSTVSKDWLLHNFPDEPFVSVLTSESLHSSMHSPIHEKEDPSASGLPERVEFVRSHSTKALEGLLRDVELGLELALHAMSRLPRASGGREPLTYRHFFVINLIDLWDRLGLQVLAGPRSDFVVFCEAVAESIGWPTEGMLSAVQKAVTHSRNLMQKSTR